MYHKKSVRIILGLITLLALGSQVFAENPSAAATPIKSVTAIAEVYGDGQKVSAVAIEYATSIKSAALKTTDFSVQGKTVSAVYANTSPTKTTKAVDGAFVIIELNTAIAPSSGMPAGPAPDAKAGGPGNGQPGFAGPKLGEKSTKSATSPILNATVVQIGDISASNGTIIKASTSAVTSTKTISLIVQDFKQLVYQDPAFAGESLMYNLYVPKNYDPSKKYPLVLFIHDAGAVSNNPIETLTQGLGAVVWASPEEQAKHESFVLAPQYNTIIADDTSETTNHMDMTIHLIQSLAKQYSIDTSRLYSTGQSMGGMTSIAMNIKYPDVFAASMLVACQWDAAKVAPMAKKPLWIVVSQGDTKANPGQDAITEALKKLGATVSKATWSAEASPQTLAQNVRDMLASGASINYTVFQNGSHRYTWQYAYSIPGIRDWLFAQHK